MLGENCVIGRGAYIGTGVRMGDHCKVQNYALVYEPARLGDGVFIGPAVVLTNDTYPRAVNPDGSLKSADDWEPVGVTIGTAPSIGARAVCVAPVTIGAWAMVAAGAVVTTDVPPHALVAGVPARQIGWVGRSRRPASRSSADAPLVDCPRPAPSTTWSTDNDQERGRDEPSIHPPGQADHRRRRARGGRRGARVRHGRPGPGGRGLRGRSSPTQLVDGRACVAVNSGTSGLHLGLLAAGIGPGDEVIVPSFTFAATANAVALTGATPVFADIEPDHFCLDPARSEAAITERTRAIMPVHLYGHPADMTGTPGRRRASTA